MTLVAPRLDDLTWDDFVELIRRDVPVESDGTWSLVAPVDPGITTLEAYSWILEQFLYRLDRTPDSLVRGIARLLDVSGARPARSATTVVAFTTEGQPVDLSAGQVVRRRDADEPALLLAEDVTVVPVDHVRLLAGGREAELGSFDPAAVAGTVPPGFPVLPADGGPGATRITLSVPVGTAVPPGAAISLLVTLSTEAIPDEWSSDAPEHLSPEWHGRVPQWVGTPAVLRWTTPTAAGPVELPVSDGTGGFRRSGIVRIPVPDVWRAPDATIGGSLEVDLSTEEATFPEPPRVTGLFENAGICHQVVVLDPTTADPSALDSALDWIKLPGEQLAVPDGVGVLLGGTLPRSVVAGQPAPPGVALQIREPGGWRSWSSTDDLGFHGPADRVFVVDRAAGLLRFGDGLAGRIPIAGPGPARIRLTAHVSLGEAGNTPRHREWSTSDDDTVTGRNPVDLSGGRAQETIDELRRRIGAELRRRVRAVTRADFEEIALGTPGVPVGRAHVAPGRSPAYPCDDVPGTVSVIVLPRVWRPTPIDAPAEIVDAPVPDRAMVAAVRAELEAARLLGDEVFVEGPRYRAVSLRLLVDVLPADAAGFRDRLFHALRAHLDPLTGGPDRTGWPFGAPLVPSQLLKVARAAVDDAASVRRVAVGLDDAPPSEDCDQLEIGRHELVVLRVLDVQVEPGTVPTRGPE